MFKTFNTMKAVISVFDKCRVVEFARALNKLGIEIIATEGTAQEILKAKIQVRKVSDFTGVQEILGEKVKIKTLHPKIHAGIATGEIGILAVNLIPLSLDIKKKKNPLDNMDIGGVAMLLSGIKNFENVAVIVNPLRYDSIVKELEEKGRISYNTKLKLAKEAMKYILTYESKVNEIIENNFKFVDNILFHGY